MLTIKVTRDDIDALTRTAMSEVGHFGRFGDATLRGGVEAVVDTILNRVAHPSYPDSIEDVVNAPFQFSAIGGPGGVKTWRRLPKPSAAVRAIVEKHIESRLGGKASTVEGAMHFLNPHFSSANALRSWGNHVVQNAIAIWGQGRDIHFHGYAPGSGPPPAYKFQMGGKAHAFTGKGISTTAEGRAGAEAPSSEEPRAAGREISVIEIDRDETLAYRVEEVPVADAASVQTTLNRHSAEGWRLRQILPSQDKLLIVFEGNQADRFVHEVDERSDGDEMQRALSSPAVVTDNTPEARFTRFLADLRLKHFKPEEFLVFGGQHFAAGPAKGKNTFPPEELWTNIKPTARVLDELRAELGAPIRLSSVYRSPAYNALLPGAASGSMHLQFRATDFSCGDGQGPVWWAKQLSRLRDKGRFRGGIGVYPTFVHLDTRGENVEFGPWRDRVFG